MKKLLLLLLITPIVMYGQIQYGNFKINNGQVIWQKVFEKDLKLESQELKLNVSGLPLLKTSQFVLDISGADLIVEKKEGRTRLTVRKIYSTTNTLLFGPITVYLEEIYINRKGEFRKSFIKKNHKLIDEIIQKEIKNLVPKNEDW